MHTTTRSASTAFRRWPTVGIIRAGFVATILAANGPSQLHAAGLIASDGAVFDEFGKSVSLSGNIGLVGAYIDDIGANTNQGSAYLFRNLNTATGTITQNVKLTASDGITFENFGASVSLSGSSGLVGASASDIGANTNQGSAYLFRNLDTASGTITQNVKLIAADGAVSDLFGISVSLSGNIGLVGAFTDDIGANNDQGSAYVFRNLNTATGIITQNVKLIAADGAASDSFGISVSLSGNIGLVGAGQDDVGANTNQGSAYLFRNLDAASGTITQNVKLIAADGAVDDGFGSSVSQSGSSGLVGAQTDDVGANTNQGSAYLFRNLNTATGTITQNVKLIASDGAAFDLFGNCVSLSGSNGLVGAYIDDIGANTNQGSVYLFRQLDIQGGTIVESVKLTASDGATSDEFGSAVSLDGDQFIIGASGKNGGTGKAYSGSISSITTLDTGSTSKTISQISFVSQMAWSIGLSTDANQVTLSAGDTATTQWVYIGFSSGADNNKLINTGTINATQINVGAVGNIGNVLQIGDGGATGTLSTGSVITNRGTVIFNRSADTIQGTHFGTAPITGTGSIIQAGTGTLTLNAANTYSGTTTVSNGTLNITGSIAGNGPANIFIAAPDDSWVGNAMLTRRVASAASYTLGSATGLGSTANSFDAVTTGGTAAILAGTASVDANVSMQWRTRQTGETGIVLSDVLSLTGVAPVGMGTDVFLLEMSYKDGVGSVLDNLGLSESLLASSGELRLGWKSGGSWVTAINGNDGGTDFFEGDLTSATFLAGLGMSPLSSKLGSYGVDTTNNKVWAVLNHNSEFAVIPEPSTLVLGTLAGLGLGVLSLRRRCAK